MKKNDNIYSSVWRDLFRIVDSIRVRSSDNRDKQFFSLTFNQLRMIHRVYTYQTENDGRGISLKALAVRLGITPAAASEMVDTLVRKSVLTRNVDVADRRAVAIVVSEELHRQNGGRGGYHDGNGQRFRTDARRSRRSSENGGTSCQTCRR